jgi:hypothetical protein
LEGWAVARERLQKEPYQRTLVRNFSKELAGDVNAKGISVIFTKVDVIRNWVETGMLIIKQQADPILLETYLPFAYRATRTNAGKPFPGVFPVVPIIKANEGRSDEV